MKWTPLTRWRAGQARAAGTEGQVARERGAQGSAAGPAATVILTVDDDPGMSRAALW
ncbi:hypothetical protein HEK616_36920 [Streptomyces nigrescens]|uniref:Uncharacterized protein n=1 Tax=Streptomyces nigrescens TaxID=1920 RepID=A0ABN6QZE6_STRNI|nr:hypothetical protein HEK616_36920 [Streptomyces nigrescens]